MSVTTRSRGRAEALEALGRAFKGTQAAVRRMRGRETHHPGELSYAQYGLLFALSDGGARSSRELALAADVSPATAAEMLDSLAASGLVERIRSQNDKRIVLTSLTERGAAVIEARRAQYEPRWRAALAGFTQDELHTATRVLDALRGMFDDLAESDH
jgi:DNA-binding MarR family transcriptional regulator